MRYRIALALCRISASKWKRIAFVLPLAALVSALPLRCAAQGAAPAQQTQPAQGQSNPDQAAQAEAGRSRARQNQTAAPASLKPAAAVVAAPVPATLPSLKTVATAQRVLLTSLQASFILELKMSPRLKVFETTSLSAMESLLDSGVQATHSRQFSLFKPCYPR
jgi:hypothetical protein